MDKIRLAHSRYCWHFYRIGLKKARKEPGLTIDDHHGDVFAFCFLIPKAQHRLFLKLAHQLGCLVKLPIYWLIARIIGR